MVLVTHVKILVLRGIQQRMPITVFVRTVAPTPIILPVIVGLTVEIVALISRIATIKLSNDKFNSMA